ncbi:MAG: thiopurine S-methyltransferase [Hyphomicrobiaceae bacterium]
MDAEFWHERWQQSNIGFHQAETEPLLQKHWPALGVTSGAAVVVPLCGKSLDMVWLAGEGHRVIGIELSQIAIDDFFAGLGLTPEKRSEPGFTVSSAGPYELWCGDFFEMPVSRTRDVAAIYDRAALIALPPDMRKRYAGKLTELGHGTARNLLITLEYDQSIVPGPPHSVGGDEVTALFDAEWRIERIMYERTAKVPPKFKANGLEAVQQAVYVLDPRNAPK